MNRANHFIILFLIGALTFGCRTPKLPSASISTCRLYDKDFSISDEVFEIYSEQIAEFKLSSKYLDIMYLETLGDDETLHFSRLKFDSIDDATLTVYNGTQKQSRSIEVEDLNIDSFLNSTKEKSYYFLCERFSTSRRISMYWVKQSGQDRLRLYLGNEKITELTEEDRAKITDELSLIKLLQNSL